MADTSTPDLHTLANTPGAGAAQAALKEAGLWDEHAGAGPEREFTVFLVASARLEACLTVKARCRSEAEQKAREKVGCDWECAGAVKDIKAETILDSGE